jgi:hypothetical protein
MHDEIISKMAKLYEMRSIFFPAAERLHLGWQPALIVAPGCNVGQSRTAARHNDRRLAESIYRAAVASGIMERVGYQDTIAEAG